MKDKDRVKVTFQTKREQKIEDFYEKEEKLLEKVEERITDLNEESDYDDSNIKVEKSYIEWPKPYGKPPYMSVVVSSYLVEKEVLEKYSRVTKEIANSIYNDFEVEEVITEGYI